MSVAYDVNLHCIILHFSASEVDFVNSCLQKKRIYNDQDAHVNGTCKVQMNWLAPNLNEPGVRN